MAKAKKYNGADNFNQVSPIFPLKIFQFLAQEQCQ
jgi:hypothetical protein